MEPPGKQIEIHYDEEGGYFLVVMRLWNEDIEVLETAADVEAAERLAYQFSLREMPYVAPNRCGNCCRNLPWSLVPWPKDHLCEICLLPEDVDILPALKRPGFQGSTAAARRSGSYAASSCRRCPAC